MPTTVDIGTLIITSPKIHGGCPIIAGTGVTVRRIAADYKMGLSAEEIVKEIPHLTLKDKIMIIGICIQNMAKASSSELPKQNFNFDDNNTN